MSTPIGTPMWCSRRCRQRGIAVPDDVRTRITTCTDLDQLLAWIQRAATADKIEDLDA